LTFLHRKTFKLETELFLKFVIIDFIKDKFLIRNIECKNRKGAFSSINCRLERIALFLFFLFILPETYSQTPVNTDTTSNNISYTDSSFTNDTIRAATDDKMLLSSDPLYDTIRKKAAKYSWIKKLHDMLIIEDHKNKSFENREIDEIFNPFKKHHGKIIDSITIQQLEVFGPSLTDTSYQNEYWYKEFGNFVHFPTNKSIIRENLLFSARDSLDPALLADNERILRSLRFIKDARIVVEEVPGKPGKVHLTVLTQDLWSKGFNVDLNSINAGQVELWDNNIFGIGHKVQGNLIFDYLKDGNPGIETFYNISNLRGTFIKSRVYYLNSFDTERYGFEIQRDLFSYKTRYIGGLRMFKTETRENIRRKDTVLSDVFLDYVNHDFWLGHSFPISSKNPMFKKRTRLILAGRYIKNRFLEGPYVDERYNYAYHNNHTFLGSISFSRENFYESELIYDYGTTEDIPVGDLITYTFGWEADEFFKRFYSGIRIKHGHFVDNFGYLSSSLGIGGFLYDKQIEQGTIDYQAKYISKLWHLNNLQIRQFFDIHYTRGIERFPEERLRFDRITDMRGYENPSLYGNKKLVVRSETVAFSGLNYYGFRFAFFGFLDCGFIGSANEFILNNQLQPGFGIGMRMRNENLVFKTFQLRLGFYPTLSNGDNFLFYISGERSLNPHRYRPSAPSKIDF